MDADLVPLKEHILALIDAGDKRLEMLFAEREKQVGLALQSAQIATDKAEAQALRVKEDQNEWRATTTDLISRFATVEALDAIKERLGLIERTQARIAGGIVVVAALSPIIAHFVK